MPKSGTAKFKAFPDVLVKFKLSKDLLGENVKVSYKDGSTSTMSRAEFERDFEVIK